MAYRLYNTTAKGYDELYGSEQLSKYKYVLEKGYRPYGIVVDIGCGTGLFLEFLISREIVFDKYICIEPSTGMLDVFLDKNVSKDYRVLLINGFWEHIPLVDEIADTVYAYTVWDNLDDKESGFRELVRILKRHGVAVVSFLKKKYVEDINNILSLSKKYNMEAKPLDCETHDCFIVLEKGSG